MIITNPKNVELTIMGKDKTPKVLKSIKTKEGKANETIKS